ncbi:MAG: hypothetical protein V3U00_01825 [Gammaproteobacteria bacterium]
MRHRIYRIGTLLGLSALVVPVLIYVAGRALVGPYEGPLGLLGLIGHIYSDASLGQVSAWFLLLSPALILLVWYWVAHLGRTRLFHRLRGDDLPQRRESP